MNDQMKSKTLDPKAKAMMEAASQAVSRTLGGIDPASLCGITISLEFDHDDEPKGDTEEEADEDVLFPKMHSKVKEYQAKEESQGDEETDESKEPK